MSFTVRILLLAISVLVVQVYFYKKIFNSVESVKPGLNSRKYKKFITPVILYFNLYPLTGIVLLLLNILFDISITLPVESAWYNFLIIYPFWVTIIIVLQSILFYLPADILRVVSFPLYKHKREKYKILNAKFVLLIAVAFFLYVPIRIFYDHNFVSTRITGYKTETDKLKHLRIVLISDIQADWYTDSDRLMNYVQKVNDVEPDLVLIAGDIITSTPNYIETAASALGQIKSKHGVISCIGDHDNWAYRQDIYRSRREVTDALAKHGIQMLDNKNLILQLDSLTVGITAITDTYSERVNEKILDSLTANLEQTDLKIFLTHQPVVRLINTAAENGYNLFFAGHTHGGQITFLFPFINLSPTLVETKYVKGDFWFGDMLMIVSRGLGMSLSPIRYNSTPEVVCLVFQS